MNRTLTCVAVFTLASSAALAQTVTNLNDSGAGSLRDAIIAANNAAGADTIVMQTGLTGTINLLTSLPTITGPLTINGNSDGNVCTKDITISGGDAVRILSINNVSVTLEDITLRDGSAGSGGRGGAIDFTATTLTPLLLLTRACFTSNQAGDGGAIHMDGGDLSATDSVFDLNTTLSGSVNTESGGAIAFNTSINAAVTLDFTDCTFSNNTSESAGGALRLAGFITTYNFTRCHFTGNQNTTFFGGGAMTVTENAGSNFDVDVNIDDCQFDNNSGVAGGALRIQVGGTGPLTVTIDDSTFHSNVGIVDGGAMMVFGGGSGTASKILTIRNSTFSGNSAGAGSGGSNSAFAGTGTVCEANLTLDSCTIVNNTGTGSNTFAAGVVGGFDIFNGNLTLTNTIFADNSGTIASAQNAEAIRHSGVGTFTDGFRNLVDDTVDLELGSLGANNVFGMHPNLAPLADGPVGIGASFVRDQMEVRYPNTGSPTLDAGATTLAFDQIGNARPGGAADDIGAIEGVNTYVPMVNTLSHGCGAGSFAIAYSGTPRIGTSSTFSLSGVTGAAFMFFSLTLINDTSSCTGCTIGPNYNHPSFGLEFTTMLTINVPCSAAFVGLPLAVQGMDYAPTTTAGCGLYSIDLTDTIKVVIGL